MTADERVISYINSLGTDTNDFLDDLYGKAVKDGVPVIRREVISFMKTLLGILMPKRILEIGTAVGFSSLLMAFGTEKDCMITTLEKDEKAAAAAMENISTAGMSERISVITGDAAVTLKAIDIPFDLVFMDAAKAQYMSYLPDVKRLMKDGSVLLADNIFCGGMITESRFLVERRDRTIHKRMREFLYEITHDTELTTSLLPLGDGLSISVMRH